MANDNRKVNLDKTANGIKLLISGVKGIQKTSEETNRILSKLNTSKVSTSTNKNTTGNDGSGNSTQTTNINTNITTKSETKVAVNTEGVKEATKDLEKLSDATKKAASETEHLIKVQEKLKSLKLDKGASQKTVISALSGLNDNISVASRAGVGLNNLAKLRKTLSGIKSEDKTENDVYEFLTKSFTTPNLKPIINGVKNDSFAKGFKEIEGSNVKKTRAIVQYVIAAEEALNEITKDVKVKAETAVKNVEQAKKKIINTTKKTDTTTKIINVSAFKKDTAKLDEIAKHVEECKKESDEALVNMLKTLKADNPAYQAASKVLAERGKTFQSFDTTALERNGKNITIDDFKKAFGITDVLIEDIYKDVKDRQKVLNKAYDDFLKFSKTTGITPSSIGNNRLVYGITKSIHDNADNKGHSTFNKISVTNAGIGDDNTNFHELGHQFLNKIAERVFEYRLNSTDPDKKIDTIEDAVAKLFSDIDLRDAIKNGNVSKKDIEIVGQVRKIIEKTRKGGKEGGWLDTTVGKNLTAMGYTGAEWKQKRDYYTRNDEVFARLVSRFVGGYNENSEESLFEVNNDKFNQFIYPLLKGLFKETSSTFNNLVDIQTKPISTVTPSKSKTNAVVEKVTNDVKRSEQEKKVNKGMKIYKIDSSSKEASDEHVKSTIAEATSFAKNFEEVINSAVKTFEEKFKSAITNMADTFKNEFIKPFKQAIDSIAGIVTSLQKAGIVDNKQIQSGDVGKKLKDDIRSDIKDTSKEAYNKETPKQLYGGNRVFANPIVFPRVQYDENNPNNSYMTINGDFNKPDKNGSLIALKNPDVREMLSMTQNASAKYNYVKILDALKKQNQVAIDTEMFRYVEEGTTQASYEKELSGLLKQLEGISKQYNKLGDSKRYHQVKNQIEDFKNTFMRNDKINLSPVYSETVNAKGEIIGTSVSGWTADTLKPEIEKLKNNISSFNTEIDNITNQIKSDKDKSDKDKSDKEMTAFDRSEKFKRLGMDFNSYLENKSKFYDEDMKNKTIASTLGLNYNAIQTQLTKLQNETFVDDNSYKTQLARIQDEITHFKNNVKQAIVDGAIATSTSKSIDSKAKKDLNDKLKRDKEFNKNLDNIGKLSQKQIAEESLNSYFDIKAEQKQMEITSNLEQIRNNAVARLTEDMNGFVRSLGTNVILRSGALTERGDVVYGAGGLTARYNPINGQGVSSDLSGIITDVSNIDLNLGAQHLNNEIQRLTIAFRELVDQTNQNINNEIKRDTFNTQQTNQQRQQDEKNLRQQAQDIINQSNIDTALYNENLAQQNEYLQLDSVFKKLNDFYGDSFRVGDNTYTHQDFYGNILGNINDYRAIQQAYSDLSVRIQNGEFQNDKSAFNLAIKQFVEIINTFKDNVKKAVTQIQNDYTQAKHDERIGNIRIANQNKEIQQQAIENTNRNINTDSLDTEMRKLIEFYGGHFNVGNQQYQNMSVIGNIQGYTDISQAYQNLRNRIQNGEFNDNQRGFTQAINEFKETVRQFRQGSEVLIRDFQNNIRQQEARARNLMTTGTRRANQIDNNILRVQRNSTLNTLFGDYGDPFMRGNVRIRLTNDEQNRLDSYRQRANTLRTSLRRRRGETVDAYNTRAERINNRLQLNEIDYNNLREEIANRTGRQTGRTFNEFQEVYNPAMQSFMQRTGLNLFKMPNERSVDWETLSRGFSSGNRGAFVLEISKFINFPSLKQGITSFVGDLKNIASSGLHMIEHAFGRMSKIALTAAGAITGLTAGISATIVAFGAFGKSVVSTTDEFRRNTLALTGVYRTPEKAHEMLQMAYATSANMPMDYSSAMTTLNEISAIPAVQQLLRSPDSKVASGMMEKMFKVITAMTTMRPDKNTSDAVFSLRNAFAGDLRSLQRRFDLPVNSMTNVKNSIGLGKVKNDPMAILDSLNNYFDSFLDMDVITQVSRTIGVIVEKIKGAFDLFKANIGNSGLYDLVLNDVDKIKNIFVNFVDSDYGKQIAKRLSDALANSYEAIKGIATRIGQSIIGAFGLDSKNFDIANVVTTLAEGFAKGLRYVENVINDIDIEGYLKKAIDYISNIDLSSIIDKISTISTQVSNVAKTIWDAVVDTVSALNNARTQLGISDETLAKGLFAVWLFGGDNIKDFIKAQMNIIVSSVQVALGTIGTAINLATAVYMTRGTAFSAFIIRSATNIYTAILGFGRSIYNTFLNLLGVFLMQTRRLLTWLFSFIRRQLVPLFAIVGEVYLIGNNFEVIGETAANVIDSIITGFSKMFAFITSGFEKICVWFSKEFESSFSFLEYVAEELDAIVDIVAGGGESLFDENGIQDYVNAFKLAFDKIMTAITHEVTYYLGKAVNGVMLPLFSGLSKIGVVSKKSYESQVSDANKEQTRVRKIADDAWSGLGDKIMNALPKRLVTKINDNRERTTNAWNKWQSDRKKTDKQLYAERQVLYDKIDVDLENTYKELDNRLAKKIEDNKKLYNPEGKEWNWTPNGDTFFGMKYDWLHEELGIPDNDATLGQMLKYALGYIDEEQPAKQEQQTVVTDTKTTNAIVTVSKTIGGIFNWLKEKTEPAIKAVTPFYKMFKPDSIATDYSKAINKETHKLNTTLSSQKSQYATGFDFDTNSVFGDSKESSDNIYFGPVRLEAMLKELNNSVRSVDEYTEKYNKAIRDNINKKEMTDIKKSLEDNRKAVYDYRIAIVNMINKSTEMIEDSVAQMDFTYVTKNIDKYVNAQSKTFDKKITSEVYKSIVQNHSRYFATNGSIGQALTEQINLSNSNIRKFVADYNSGKTTITTNSIEEQNIIREFVEKLGYYLNTLTPIINEQNRIKGTQANIGNMRLGELNSNWGRYINDRNKAVRTTAGERYIALMNEGIESDTMGSMVRKVRDIAINSFTDMKTAVINAVQETVKSTQQTIKNGLDKMVMEGGSFKKSFKEIGDTIKKNYAGIYTNEIANNVTKFLYGYSENEQKDPVVTLNTNVVEFKDDVLQKMDTLNDSINNIDIMRSIQRRNDIPAVSIVETDNGLIKGSVQHHEKLGSTLESLNSKYADFNTISNGIATRLATDIGKDSNKYDDFIKEASNLYGIETSLIKAVINTESSFRMLKANEAGAIGLMQVTGGAASDVNRKFGTHYDINNPKDNIMLGTAYLRMQLDKFGNQNLALAAYNAGAGRVIDAKGIPNIKETQNYIPTVNMFKDVFAEREKSNEESQQITSLDSNVSDIRNDIKQIVTGTSANVSRTGYSEINAPTINNIISGTSEGFNLNGLFGGINIPSGIADLGNRAGFGVIGNAISKASGLSVLKSLFSTGSKSNSSKLLNLVFNKDKGYFDSATLTSSGSNILNSAINAAGIGGVVDVAQMMNLAGADLQEPQTPLKGIWGDLFGTVENVESKFGGAAVGSLLGNMMAGKNLVDSLGAVALKTFGEGTDGAKMVAGSNTLSKGITGLTSTLFGKSAGQSVAKFLGKNFLGTTVGTALPIIGTVAKVLSGKGWFGGAKDRTAEGRARGAEFNALRDSLVANRNTMARNYYMANDDTVDALKNYKFSEVAMWTSKRGSRWKGTRRKVMNTDATAFTKSIQGYWDLLQQADEENRTTQRTLNKLQNTNNLEYLRQTGSYEEKRLSSIQSDLEKYKATISKYAGHDTGFKQKLFDGKEYTLTELNDKVNDLIKELGDSKDAIAQNTEAIRQEKLATADAKLDYETALYGKYNPLISYQNEIQKLNNEWNSVMNDDGTIGYKENTKEWFNWSTRMLQATDNLEEATKQLEESAKQFKYDVANNWVNTLTQIRKSDGIYSASQVKNIANAYRKKVAVDSVGNNLESVMAGINPSEMSYTEDVFKTQTTYGKQNVTKWDMLSPNVKRVLSDLKRTGRASGNGLRGQEVQQINSLLKSSNGNLSGLIDNLQNEVVGTRSVAIGTKQVKIGERTYTGTSPIKEGAYTNIVNMIKDYNKATGSNIRWQDYFDTKGTYATLYDKSSGTFDESTFTKDIQKSLKTTEGKNALMSLGITADTSFKALSDKYNAAANATYTTDYSYTSRYFRNYNEALKWAKQNGYTLNSNRYYGGGYYGLKKATKTASQKKTTALNATNTEYLNALKEAGYGTTAGSLTQKDGMYLFNAGGDKGNYQLFKFTKEQANQFVQTVYGKSLEDYMKYSSKQVKVDNYSLKKNVSLDKLFKLVENGIIKYSELLGKELEHQIAMANFENVVDDIKQNITNVMTHTTTSAMDTIKANLESIKIVNKNSKDFLDTGDYTGYDDFMDKVIRPLVQNIGGEMQNIASVYEQLFNSGFMDKSSGKNPLTHMTDFMNKLQDAQYAYIVALETGSTNDVRLAKNELDKLLNANSTYFKNLSNDYKNATLKLQQEISKDYILDSISGYENYDIANDALKDFDSAFGKGAMKKLLGVTGNMNNFNSDNIGNWFGVSGDDLWLTNIELQKQRTLNKYKLAEKDSEEAAEAQREYWKLAQESAEYLKKKAEETKSKIEEMLGKIEETVKTRVAEESKSTKGDFVYIDMGATRKGGEQYARQLLNSIKTDDPEAQKLIKEVAKRMGVK